MSAYFSRFEGVWAQGDYGERTDSGGYIIHGRSDAVLNPGGVRIGTAEIYRQVERIEDVVESIVIGQEWGDDVRVVLFVVLREGVSLTDELRARIRQSINLCIAKLIVVKSLYLRQPGPLQPVLQHI